MREHKKGEGHKEVGGEKHPIQKDGDLGPVAKQIIKQRFLIIPKERKGKK